MATKITKSELKQMIREALRAELTKSNTYALKEAARATSYTEADFAWDEAAMIAEYKDAALKYLNGADIEDALAGIKANLTTVGALHLAGGAAVRESAKSSDCIKESFDSKEFKITYRLASWPASHKNTELLLDAESEADAREAFLDYMFDPDNYYDEDAYTPATEDEIEILDISATGK